MLVIDLSRSCAAPMAARAFARVAARWLVALVALLVATSFGALEVGGARSYDDEGVENVVAAADGDGATDAQSGGRDVPEEERDDDEERDEERDDDERTETLAMARGASSGDRHEHGLHGVVLRVRRAAWEERGERGAYARMIDRPPHA